jgi:SAM-dependent methyltransferase
MSLNYEFVLCALCGTDDCVVLFNDIVKCRKCGLVYRNPRKIADDITDKYSKSIVTAADKIDISKKPVYVDWLNKAERIYPFKNKKVLDVGCGQGYFLYLARKYDWDISGVEVSKKMAGDVNKKLGDVVFCGTLNEAGCELDSFDVVTFWDVLACIPEPLAVLQETKRALKKDGQVVIRVRNALFHVFVNKYFGKISAIFGLKPVVFHLYSFSADTIKTMLQKAGYRDVVVKNSVLTSRDPYGQGKVFSSAGMGLIKFVLNMFFKIVYFISGRRAIWSSTIIIYAKK